jgi:formate-dependent nitrite reductase membrane component NrfD
MHPDEHTAAKCNYCSHRTDIGLEPACVNVCPEHAIISGDMDNPQSEISQLLAREAVTVRKPEKGTKPKLFYIDGDNASLDPTAANPDTDYMWSSQSSGVGHYAKFAEERKRNADALVRIERRPTRGMDTPQAASADEGVRNPKPRRVYDAPGKGVLWGWEVSAYIWTKAIAAGAFLVPVLGRYLGFEISENLARIGAVVAFVFLTITGVLLIMDLGRPDRFLNVLFRPQWKSWLSRGAYIITAYGGILTVWLLASFLGFGSVLKFIEPLGVIFALLSAVYTAFLFAQAKGRDLWQSPMLGLHMLIHSLMAGFAVFLIANLFAAMSVGFVMALTLLTIVILIFHLITLAIELTTTHTTEDAHAAAKMITSGEFSRQFWLGMIFFGNTLPLLLLLTGQIWAFAIAGIFILVGLYFAEHIWVKAPQRIPLS